ncbi:MAG: hypothetical protein JXR48_17445 [Candidatus Delongbacteria bacterium]|nr:hypothetical protein [Candidatus Delongbacteria bacterium]MBN2836745.1 hypothetical protein [Candidatus Delongbacteria bacterium]
MRMLLILILTNLLFCQFSDFINKQNGELDSALTTILMDRNDIIFPVSHRKTTMVFPSIISYFDNPLKQIEDTENYENSFSDFFNPDFSILFKEYKIDEDQEDEYEFIFDFEKNYKIKISSRNKDIENCGRYFKIQDTNIETSNAKNDYPDKETEDIANLIKDRLGEREYYITAAHYFKDTLATFNYSQFVEKGIYLHRSFLDLVRNLSLGRFDFANLPSYVKIGSFDNDVYTNEECLILIDRGGDDIYDFGDRKVPPVIIDLSGNDIYKCNKEGFGSSNLEYSFFYDGSGDDIYETKNHSIGATYLGYSVFCDMNGSDIYRSKENSQCSAEYGFSLFYDGNGNDTYIGEEKCQSFSGVYGISFLIDKSGNDNYILSSSQVDVLRYADHFNSMGQGFSIGERPYAGGGFAYLYDYSGNDSYVSDIFGQGSSYWYGSGVLSDKEGNDSYNSYQYSIGSGVHFAFGSVFDYNGDDYYKSKGVSLGCGHDYASGILFDLKGNDNYSVESLSIGGGNANGFSLFTDFEGNDNYVSKHENTLGYSDWRRDGGLIGIFMDLDGTDHYGAPYGKDNSIWFSGTWGVGIDKNK